MPEKHVAYDLMVLIDPETPDERRSQLIDSVKKQIKSGGGSLRGDVDWGKRALAYEIDHHPEAHYHLFQLEAASELLNQLGHTLAIEDTVLRHRIIRLPRGAPDEPPAPPPAPRQPHSSPEAPDKRPKPRQKKPAEDKSDSSADAEQGSSSSE